MPFSIFLKLVLSLYLVAGCTAQPWQMFGGQGGVQNHCPNSQTRHKCVKGQGSIWANTNRDNWNPTDEVNAGVDKHWSCTPCCLVEGTSIQSCNDEPTMMHDDSGESVGIEEGSNGQQSNGFIGGDIQTIGQQAIGYGSNGQINGQRNGRQNSGYRSGPNVGREAIRRQNTQRYQQRSIMT